MASFGALACALGVVASCTPPPREAHEAPAPTVVAPTTSTGPACPSRIAHHPLMSAPRPPAGWHVAPTPVAGSETLACANLSRSEWRVEAASSGALVRARTVDPDDALPVALTAPSHVAHRRVRAALGGYLVGWSEGSGAVLDYVPSTGGAPRELAKGIVVGFSEMRTGLVVFLEKRGALREASAYRVAADAAGNVSATAWLDLGGGIEAVLTESPESTLLLSTTGLDRLTACGDLSRLGATDYDVLYPSSLAEDASGVIYVGMRHFVARWIPTAPEGYREEWLTRDGCSLLAREKFECVCRG